MTRSVERVSRGRHEKAREKVINSRRRSQEQQARVAPAVDWLAQVSPVQRVPSPPVQEPSSPVQ
ncbi:MAG: hypothetical protein ACK59B_01780, partial [Alphaproteobacteria bacterium]